MTQSDRSGEQQCQVKWQERLDAAEESFARVLKDKERLISSMRRAQHQLENQVVGQKKREDEYLERLAKEDSMESQPQRQEVAIARELAARLQDAYTQAKVARQAEQAAEIQRDKLQTTITGLAAHVEGKDVQIRMVVEEEIQQQERRRERRRAFC